jgi:hypothetical protein
LIEAVEKTVEATSAHGNGAGKVRHESNGHAADRLKELGIARANLVREAQRVGKLRNIKVSDVIDRAAKGAFRFTDLRRLAPDALPALKTATELLRQVGQ